MGLLYFHFLSTDLFRATDTITKLYATAASLENLLLCLTVCYTAGNVYEQSRRLVRILILTPSDVFNDEVSVYVSCNNFFLNDSAFKIERMILQLRQTQPALTGQELFAVKHSLILHVS